MPLLVPFAFSAACVYFFPNIIQFLSRQWDVSNQKTSLLQFSWVCCRLLFNCLSYLYMYSHFGIKQDSSFTKCRLQIFMPLYNLPFQHFMKEKRFHGDIFWLPNTFSDPWRNYFADLWKNSSVMQAIQKAQTVGIAPHALSFYKGTIFPPTDKQTSACDRSNQNRTSDKSL